MFIRTRKRKATTYVCRDCGNRSKAFPQKKARCLLCGGMLDRASFARKLNPKN